MDEYKGIGPQRSPETPLVVVGCDFRQASAVFRGQLVTTSEDRVSLFNSIRKEDPDAGFMALETCNRIEWIVSTEHPKWIGELLQAQMLNRWVSAGADLSDLPQVNVYRGRAAAIHLFRLSAGMESLAMGEAEVAGQVQRALRQALDEKTSSRILNGLGRFAGGIAKTSQKLGFRSAHSRGIHVMTAWYIEKRFPSPGPIPQVLVLGMGEIGRKTADFIEQNIRSTVVRLNRTVTDRHRDQWLGLDQLPQALAGADVLVTASGARTPVVTPDRLRPRSGDKPLLVVDLGIPAQVSPDAARIPGVEYKCVDDLLEVRSPDDLQRLENLDEAIEQQVGRFNRFCLERHMVHLLRRAQDKRFELIQEKIDSFVAGRLGDILEDQDRALVIATMKSLVREFSSDVFDSVHNALEEYWSNQ